MDVQTFWDLISQSDRDGQHLASLLQELKPEEIRGFGDLLDLHFNKAFNWNLWAAAYLINGGCSEEEFRQFLYWLISLGEEAYTKAVKNPDSLVEVVKDDEYTFTEDIIIAIARSLDRLGQEIEGKSNVTIPAEMMEFKKRPKKPRGKEWEDDDELLEMFPKLGERFGEMLEWDEEEGEDWEDEDEGKSKLRKAWDKFVDFFANIFDKFIKLFKKKEKKEEEEPEGDPNRLEKNMKINFWVYLAFLIVSIGFFAMIIVTALIRNNILKEIATLEAIKNLDFGWVISNWNTLTSTIIDKYITGIVGTPWGGLWNRWHNWGSLQYLWIICAFSFLIVGLPFIKLLMQPRYVQLTPKSMDFLNKKEALQFSIDLKKIESIDLSRSNTIQIRPKEKTDLVPIFYLDIISVKSFKKYCIEHRIEINEDTHIMKMLYLWVTDKIKKSRNQ